MGHGASFVRRWQLLEICGMWESCDMVLRSGTASWESQVRAFRGLRLSKADMELYGVRNICCCSPCVGCAHHRVLMALRPWVKSSDRWRYPGETREQYVRRLKSESSNVQNWLPRGVLYALSLESDGGVVVSGEEVRVRMLGLREPVENEPRQCSRRPLAQRGGGRRRRRGLPPGG